MKIKTFFYSCRGQLSPIRIVVRCRTLAFAIAFVQARMTEEIGRPYFADEKDFTVFEKDFEGVVYSDCGNFPIEIATDIIPFPSPQFEKNESFEAKRVTNSLRRQNVV